MAAARAGWLDRLFDIRYAFAQSVIEEPTTG